MAGKPKKKPCCFNKRKFLLPSLMFFIGTTLGFLLSPIKRGIGNDSGNVTNHYYGKDES